MFNFLVHFIMAQKIWQRFVFAKLDENNEVVYFTPYHNMLRYQDGNGRWHNVSNPNEAQMNLGGWYRLVNVFEEGTDYVLDNVLYHFVGAIPEEDEGEGEE